ncbi:MAG: glycoside hydrolase family 10 protein [Longimicrobiales bacterium]
MTVAVPPAVPAPPAVPHPPALLREFRGVWVATVGNRDWPSRPGLPVDEQKNELIRILDTARRLNLNAVVFQVRPAADAFYASTLEPWSEYLMGQMGRAPDPAYDPLEFAINEAHRRGLELHAWFNPYRARFSNPRLPPAAMHISRTRPDLVRPYGQFLWMDPGEVAVREHALAVIADVVRRYDIDGVHIDDYFYPYQQRDRNNRLIPFPDDVSWARYRQRGGELSRDDWRRSNVDLFVEQLYTRVKAIKPTVKVGISPFGIWRPGHPPSVVGLDAYTEIYADARKWLRAGWVDYIVPQLYWRHTAPEQSYVQLLRWWVGQNEMHRHVWAGNAPYRVASGAQSWPAREIIEQIELTRAEPGATGNIHFSMAAFLNNRGGLADTLTLASYAQTAVVPRSVWLDAEPPPEPIARIEPHWLLWATLAMEPAPGEPPFLWAIRVRFGDEWLSEVMPALQRRYLVPRRNIFRLPDEIAISAIDRNGNESDLVRLDVKR